MKLRVYFDVCFYGGNNIVIAPFESMILTLKLFPWSGIGVVAAGCSQQICCRYDGPCKIIVQKLHKKE
jgi:hypothetical protein